MKNGYLLVDILISMFIGMTALMVITELLISLALFTKIISDEVRDFTDSTFAVDFIQLEMRKRYMCCWRTEKVGFYSYFGYVGMVDGREKLIVYRSESHDGGESILMRCSSSNPEDKLSSAMCNNLIYRGKERVEIFVEDRKLKVIVGRNSKVINLGGIGYGL